MCSVSVVRRGRFSVFTLGASALLMFAAACGGHYVSRASDLYADGRYVEAAEVFEKTEQRLAQSSSDERARFGLYRGATFMKLGDGARAARWLGYSREIVKTDPGALSSSDLALLDASLKALASARPAAPASATNAEVATAPSATDAAAPSQ